LTAIIAALLLSLLAVGIAEAQPFIVPVQPVVVCDVDGTVCAAISGSGSLSFTYPTGLTTVTTVQLAVTAVAQQLSSIAGRLVCLKVLDGGTQNVKFGPSGVTTATGQELVPGEGACRPADNANRFFVIAAGAGSTIAYEVWN